MPTTTTTGRLYTKRGVHHARVTTGPRSRAVRRLHPSLDETAADKRAKRIGDLVNALRAAGQDSFVMKAIDDGAAADEQTFEKIVATVRGLCAGKLSKRPPKAMAGETFQTFAERWTKGELARSYPDHVKEIRSMNDNKARLETYVYPKIGPLPIEVVTLDQCLDIMAALPKSLSSASRRHVAQVIHRIFALAVFPARVITASPLPRGFLPRIGARKARGFIFPSEEAALLACADVPIELRLLLGFLHREGCRKDEAATLQWSDKRRADAAGWIDVERGWLYLETHKTSEKAGARDWPLDPGVADALRVWRKLHPKARYVFQSGKEPFPVEHLAEDYRAALKKAGVERPELHVTSKTRMRINAHDTRGVFITISMAAGQSERWITRRTGHTTSEMLSRYKRSAEGLAEGADVTLAPLVDAIPELAIVARETSKKRGDEAGTGETTADDGPPADEKTRPIDAMPDGTLDSKSVARKGMRVQVPPSALSTKTRRSVMDRRATRRPRSRSR